jgi:hypothetical protein
LFVALWLAAPAAAQIEIDLVPPFVEKTVRQESTVRDAIVFRNRGSTPLDVSVETVDFAVDAGGRVIERPPGSRDDSLAPYLRIAPMQSVVAPGSELAFRWEATAPGELTHRRVMVFFRAQPRVERSDTAQVVLVPRLGVPIYVESADADPARLEIATIDVARSDEQADRLRLVLDVTNTGQRNIRPTGEVRVRSADGEAISFPVNEGRDSVVPGARRRFVQEYGPVPGGGLSVEVVFDVSPRERHRERLVVPAASPLSASPAS